MGRVATFKDDSNCSRDLEYQGQSGDVDELETFHPKVMKSDISPDDASEVKSAKGKGKVVLTYEFTCQDCKQRFRSKLLTISTEQACMIRNESLYVRSVQGGSRTKEAGHGTRLSIPKTRRFVGPICGKAFKQSASYTDSISY
jgi:hypothetical protein